MNKNVSTFLTTTRKWQKALAWCNAEIFAGRKLRDARARFDALTKQMDALWDGLSPEDRKIAAKEMGKE